MSDKGDSSRMALLGWRVLLVYYYAWESEEERDEV
jgi:hypothetical protein